MKQRFQLLSDSDPLADALRVFASVVAYEFPKTVSLHLVSSLHIYLKRLPVIKSGEGKVREEDP